MTISRRQFVSSVAGAGIASMAAPNLVMAQNSGPIRVGLMAAKTGPDSIYIDGMEGGTGAGPHIATEETGVPGIAAIRQAAALARGEAA